MKSSVADHRSRRRAGELSLHRSTATPAVLHLRLASDDLRPDGEQLERLVAAARADPTATAVRTPALFPNAAAPFAAAGFVTVSRLALLRADLTVTPAVPDRRPPAGAAPARTVAARTVTVRRRELGALAAIDAAAFEPGWSHSADDLAAVCAATPIHHLTGRTTDRRFSLRRTLTAFAIAGATSTHGYLQRLSVHPAHHRAGHGRALTVDAMEWMRRRRLHACFVNTGVDNAAALSLYATLGFRRLDDELQVMQLTLRAGDERREDPAAPGAMSTPARRARRLAGGIATALVVGLLTVAAPGPAAATGLTPARDAATAAPPPSVAATALRGHAYAVALGEPLSVQLTVDAELFERTLARPDEGTAPAPGGDAATERATFVLHPAVTTLAELDAALDGADTDADADDTETGGDGGAAEPQRLDIGPDHVVAVTARDDVIDVDLALPVATEAGIHPITIAIGDRRLRSVIRVVDRAAPPVAVTTAVLLAVDDPGPFPTAAAAAAARTDVRRLVELSAQVGGPLSLALPPAAARLYHTATPAGAPPLATALADDLLLARTANAIDPSAAIHRGAGAAFSTDLRDGDDELAQLVPLAATRRTVWYADADISRPAAGFLRLLGVRVLLFGPGQAPDPARPGASFGVDLGDDQRMVGIAATVFDHAGRLLPATGSPATPDADTDPPVPHGTASDDEPSPVTAAARLAAGVELHAGEQQTDALVLTPADAELADARMLALFAGHAQRGGTITFAGLAAVANVAEREAGGDDRAAMTLPETAGTDLGLRLWAAGIVQTRVDQARSMLVDPDHGADWNRRITTTLSAVATDADADAELAAVRSEADAIIGALVPPEPVPFTLTGTDTALHFTVGNTADVDLRAIVSIRSSKLEPRSTPEERIIPAGGTETFDVSVKARSNGTFSVVVDVLSPDGQHIASTPNIKATVTRLGGLGQVVSGSLALVLLSWWYSHFRRRARNAAAVREATAAS